MSKFIYSFGIILFGLSLGYVIQLLVRRKRVKLPIDIDALRLQLQRIALLVVNPIAKYYSSSTSEERIRDHLKNLARDPFILVALSSIIIGGLLNFSGVDRPEFYATIIAVFVPLMTIMLLTSIGLALRFRRVRDYLRECFALSIIKFISIPILATSLAYVIGFGKINEGLPLKVVMILSCMPVAFTALIPPSIYDLDLDLANSCWFFTTALLVIVLPILLVLINWV